jgi:hypothetical protein
MDLEKEHLLFLSRDESSNAFFVEQAEPLTALPSWPEQLSIFGSTDFDGA